MEKLYLVWDLLTKEIAYADISELEVKKFLMRNISKCYWIEAVKYCPRDCKSSSEFLKDASDLLEYTERERKDKQAFIYLGENVSWEDMPLEVRRDEYPWYFDEEGNDCYPYIRQ